MRSVEKSERAFDLAECENFCVWRNSLVALSCRANHLDGRDWRRWSTSVSDDSRKSPEMVEFGHPAVFVKHLLQCFDASADHAMCPEPVPPALSINNSCSRRGHCSLCPKC